MQSQQIWTREIGRPKKFANPEEMWNAACDYFQWCDENPLYESKAFAFQGSITYGNMPKMRAYTLSGFCLHAGINEAYFRQFNDEGNPEFSTVIEKIERTIYTQKFTGAAADLLNANIIARDLGLADKKEIKNENPETIIFERVIKDADKP